MGTSHQQDEDQIRRAVSELKEGKFLENARERGRRRKSPWNVLMFALMIAALIVLVIGGHRLIWALHVAFHPRQQGLELAFWRRNMDLARFLMSVPMWLASLPIAMVFANFVTYRIPPARRALTAEDRGYKGVDYATSQRALTRVAIWMFLGAALLVTIGAAMQG